MKNDRKNYQKLMGDHCAVTHSDKTSVIQKTLCLASNGL